MNYTFLKPVYFGLGLTVFKVSRAVFLTEVESRTQGSRPRTQKKRGQGQPFPGQTLSKPRTGMLEAKDQGHSRKCSQKNKGL